MPEQQPETFEFVSYRLAGFLFARGVPFTGTRLNERGETSFQFTDSDTARKLVNEYLGSPESKYDDACKRMHELTQVRRTRR
jgi:hypothetical protein